MWKAAIWSGSTTTENIFAVMYQVFASDEGVSSGYSLFTSFDMTANTATNRSPNLGSDPTAITGADLVWAAVPPNGGFAFEFTGVDPDGVSLGTILVISSQASTFECWMKMSTAPGVSTLAMIPSSGIGLRSLHGAPWIGATNRQTDVVAPPSRALQPRHVCVDAGAAAPTTRARVGRSCDPATIFSGMQRKPDSALSSVF
jgi:hypothetical protein